MSEKAKCECGQEFYDATCFMNHKVTCMTAKNKISKFDEWYADYNASLHLQGDGIQGGTIKDFMRVAWNAQQSRNDELVADKKHFKDLAKIRHDGIDELLSEKRELEARVKALTEGLKYHQEMTRPIKQTQDLINQSQ